jgi:hypothetical protein
MQKGDFIRISHIKKEISTAIVVALVAKIV